MATIARYLAAFYLGYFGLLGVILPYLSLYFLDIGLTPYQIGILMAINPLVKTVAPSIWGWCSDRKGTRKPFMHLAAGGALITFALLLGVREFWSIALVLGVYAVFTSAILPLVEATAMEAVDIHSVDYGRIRLWGSVGFIVCSLGLGPVLDVAPLITVVWVVLLFLSFNVWSVRHLPDSPPLQTPHEGGITRLLGNPRVLGFYAVCMLMQASHGAYYGFFSIHLEELDFSRRTIGILWAVGVAAEVVAMAYSSRLLARFGTRPLMVASLLLAALRWGMLGTTVFMPLLVTAQLLHAASFGLFHVAAVTHTHRLMPEALRVTGQSLYSSLSFGLGLTVGMYLCGRYYESAGASTLFLASAGVVLLAAGMAMIPPRKRGVAAG